MRKTLPIVFLSICSFLLISSCSDSSDDKTSCADVTAFEVVQQANQVNFSIAASNALTYEVSYILIGNSYDPNNGTIITSNTPTGSIPANLLNTHDYLFYARTVCDGTNKGKWIGPKKITVQQYCDTPNDLYITSQFFRWNESRLSGEEVSNYQVEYGPLGFKHGTGTIVTVNNSVFSGYTLTAGEHYDFYVRAYCKNNVGYGNWAGPISYYAGNGVNLCEPPKNISYETTRIQSFYSKLVVKWSVDIFNGPFNFEYTLVPKNEAIKEGDIRTCKSGKSPVYNNLYNGIDYDFYVRAKCNGDKKSEWSKKTIVF